MPHRTKQDFPSERWSAGLGSPLLLALGREEKESGVQGCLWIHSLPEGLESSDYGAYNVIMLFGFCESMVSALLMRWVCTAKIRDSFILFYFSSSFFY